MPGKPSTPSAPSAPVPTAMWVSDQAATKAVHQRTRPCYQMPYLNSLHPTIAPVVMFKHYFVLILSLLIDKLLNKLFNRQEGDTRFLCALELTITCYLFFSKTVQQAKKHRMQIMVIDRTKQAAYGSTTINAQVVGHQNTECCFYLRSATASAPGIRQLKICSINGMMCMQL